MKKQLLAILSVLTLAFAGGACNMLGSTAQQSSSANSTESSVVESSSKPFTESVEESSSQTETSAESSAAAPGHKDYTAFTAAEKALFNEYFGETIPFIHNNEYYVEEYTLAYEDANMMEEGLNFYAYDNGPTEFEAYKTEFDNKYEFAGSEEDEYGDTWYYYDAENYYVDLSYYQDGERYVVDVYAYVLVAWNDGDSSTNSSSDSSDDIVDSDFGEILTTLYGLTDGESVTGEFTLTGKIISLDDYDNPTIVVTGFEGMPVYCYRLRLPDASIGDIITVTATTLKNYMGTYEFMNCTLVNNQGGNGSSAVVPPVESDAEEILTTLYGLTDGESVTGEFTLTGKIISLDDYDNPTIVVTGFEGMPVYCYRLRLPDASIGDIITVTATTLKNYMGTYEFMNCTLVNNQGGGNGGSQGGNNGNTSHTYTGFTADEKAMFESYFGEVIPFIANDEYYVEEYTLDYAEDGVTEEGLNFYAFGNTEGEFNAYKAILDSKYEFAGSEEDEYGDTWYYYNSAEYYIDVTHYYYEGAYVLDLYAYFYTEYTGGGDIDNGNGGNTADVDLITNEGKGLPTSANGVYTVDFTKAKYVKNVTEQGYYVDGCPTLSTDEYNPSVLVIPVEFSDVTAASKGYTISAIKDVFNGGEGATDYYSVHDYYYISSYGKLDLNITVLDSWFQPQNPSSYYANATIDYFGQEVFGGDQLIMDEALAYLSERMDLSVFDADGNTCIDAVVLINTLDIDSDSDFQWAYRYWNVYADAEGYYYEYDGVSANDYLWASYQFILETYDKDGNAYYEEGVRNTYTYIHEFGHILGADDYYDTSYSTEDDTQTPMGGCDVMDSLLGDHNAYTKFNYGWLTSSRLIVAEESVTLTLEDFSKNGDTIIIANNWDDDLGAYQEYYIVAYYTMNGLNGTVNGTEYGYFSRDGIVVYHVNASLYGEEYDGETYYDVYNNNTDGSDQYGTADNLIEFVKSPEDTYTYIEGDSLSSSITDDQGNQIAYTFTVDSLTEDSATLTFKKN